MDATHMAVGVAGMPSERGSRLLQQVETEERRRRRSEQRRRNQYQPALRSVPARSAGLESQYGTLLRPAPGSRFVVRRVG